MACRNFGDDWSVQRITDRALVCTKGSTEALSNCDYCDSWRLVVWEDGGFERSKGERKNKPESMLTFAGKYYGGKSPCRSNNYPLCGDWITGGIFTDIQVISHKSWPISNKVHNTKQDIFYYDS